MARDKKLFEMRNAKIIQEYSTKSKQKKYAGQEWKIYRYLRNKYFITNRTIDHILNGSYTKTKKPFVDPNQLSLLNIAGV